MSRFFPLSINNFIHDCYLFPLDQFAFMSDLLWMSLLLCGSGSRGKTSLPCHHWFCLLGYGEKKKAKSTTQRLVCEGLSTGKAENFILNESVLLKSVAQRKPSHAVSLMLVVFICLMYCYSSMLYPLCIEVNDSIQPKAIGTQAPYSFLKKSSYPSWASIHLEQWGWTGGGTAAACLWGWRDLWL